MNKSAFSLDDFPILSTAVRAKWSVVYLEPAAGSDERLAVGVAVAVENRGVMVRANKLERLECLYGPAGEHVRFIAEIGMEALSEDLAERGLSALTDPDLAFSGMRLGRLRDGAGESLEAIAQTWLPLVSSFHDQGSGSQPVADIVERSTSTSTDPLPALVAKKVTDTHPDLVNFFRPEIRPNPAKLKRNKSIKPMIDFSGSSFCTNMCSLPFQRISLRGKEAKIKMIDLVISRDEIVGGRSQLKLPYQERNYALIIHRPGKDDLVMNGRSASEINDMIGDLEGFCRTEEIDFRSSDNIDDIVSYLIGCETKNSGNSIEIH